MLNRLNVKRPITPYIVTQPFGGDLNCIDIETRTKCISRTREGVYPAGYESLYLSSGLNGHNGVDLVAAHTQPVYAATDGLTYKVVSEERRGIGVEIVSKEWFHLDGIERAYRVKTRYWHLDSYVVTQGQEIKAGELIGYADNTGLSSGTHLHFELKPVRRRFPSGFRNVFQKNGYFGAMDPEPYFGD